jgi:hypothetical protein
MSVVAPGELSRLAAVNFSTYPGLSLEDTRTHHWGVLFGREAFGRVGVDFAWNVHVVKIGNSGAGVAKSAILPRSNGRGAVGAVLKLKQKWPHQRPLHHASRRGFERT